jgi:hypothetical protein
MPGTLPSRSGFALWLVVLAIIVTVTVVLIDGDPRQTPRPATVISATDPVVRQLAVRLDQLERQIALLRLPATVEPRTEPLSVAEPWSEVPMSGSGARTLSGLEARLAQLEEFEGKRQRVLAEQAMERARQVERRRTLQLGMRDAAHALILDPERTDAEKAQAWNGLSELDVDAWTDEVVLEMARIGEQSEDDRAREVAWIGADSEQRSDLIVDPLIRALASDPQEDVREEAADALGHYLHVPGVGQALRYASLHDASSQVRQEALASLESGA